MLEKRYYLLLPMPDYALDYEGYNLRPWKIRFPIFFANQNYRPKIIRPSLVNSLRPTVSLIRPCLLRVLSKYEQQMRTVKQCFICYLETKHFQIETTSVSAH